VFIRRLNPNLTDLLIVFDVCFYEAFQLDNFNFCPRVFVWENLSETTDICVGINLRAFILGWWQYLNLLSVKKIHDFWQIKLKTSKKLFKKRNRSLPFDTQFFRILVNEIGLKNFKTWKVIFLPCFKLVEL
jgi:hypothetical protein